MGIQKGPTEEVVHEPGLMKGEDWERQGRKKTFQPESNGVAQVLEN